VGVKRLLLLDGDLFAYRNAAGAEKPVDWGDGQWTLSADEGVAVDNLEAEINETAAQLHDDHWDAVEIVVCLSSPDNYRKDLYPDYKAHRKDVRKPMALKACLDYLRSTHEVKEKPGLEADDVLGILATNPKLYPDREKIIVSADKDMRTIPGLLYDGHALHSTSLEEANLRHLIQTLSGDQADNYKGCKAIGPVKAARIAQGGWEAVLEAFLKAGHDEAYALTMARLARILRHGEFNYKTQEPILWNPN
jgi:DNA polymerase-1